MEISKDDEGFLKTVKESTTKSGDHYIVPLHFKIENLIMLVVFDCSSQFAEKPLNQELLTGPDLTDPIIRVLNKFRSG